jgi:hypothetical protein
MVQFFLIVREWQDLDECRMIKHSACDNEFKG